MTYLRGRTFVVTGTNTGIDGARTSLYCATDPAIAADTGRYYDACAEKVPSAVATPELARELWERSEAWLTG